MKKAPTANKDTDKEESEDNLTPNQYNEIRKKKLDELRNKGQNPYPHKFDVTTGLEEFIEKYNKMEDGTTCKDDGEISVAGRIHSYRASSTKLIFYDLRGEGLLIYVVIRK